MKKLIYCLLLITISCNANTTKNIDQKKDLDKTEFEISITPSAFGDKHYTLILIPKKLTKKYGEIYDKSPYAKKLSKKELTKINDFLEKFPLNELKQNYSTPVKDGIQYLFSIRIGEKSKEIRVSNAYQQDLGELVNLINTLMPKEHHIHFEE